MKMSLEKCVSNKLQKKNFHKRNDEISFDNFNCGANVASQTCITFKKLIIVAWCVVDP